MDESIERILVTGAQGFLGRHVVRALIGSYHDAKILGIGRSKYKQDVFTHSISWRGKLIQAPIPRYLLLDEDSREYEYAAVDLLDKSATSHRIQDFQPDVVIHLASALMGDAVEDVMRIGVEGTVSLLEALTGSSSRKVRFIYASSGAIYGRVAESMLPIEEDTPTKPIDLYGLSKLAGEHVCRILGEIRGIEVIYARLFNLVGPGQDERHVCGSFAAQAAAISLGLTADPFRTGDLDATRDFIDVRDSAHAIVLLVQKASGSGIYNIASGEETAVKSILTTINRHAGLSNRVTSWRAGGPPVGVRRHFGSAARLERLGFQKEFCMDVSLKDLLNYYLCEVALSA
jgi:nucleoside-diphosphate-sugar epimerase